jgi:hypothetical protein
MKTRSRLFQFRKGVIGFALLGLVGMLGGPRPLQAQSQGVEAKASAVSQKAIEYLTKQGQSDDGSFSAKAGPGVTALVVTSILKNGGSIDTRRLQRGSSLWRAT